MKPQLTVMQKLLKKARRSWQQWLAFARMLRAFLPHIRKQKKRLIAAQIFGLLYILFDLLEPWPLKLIFDSVFLGKPLPALLVSLLGGLEAHRLVLLNILIGIIIAIALLQGVCYYFEHLFTSMAGQQIISGVRLDLYRHLQYLSISFYDRRRLGDLMSRLTTDIRILRDILVSMPLDGSSKFLLNIGMIIVMFVMDAQLTLVALIAVPMLVLLLKRYQRPMRQTIREQREREGQLASLATEVLGAMKAVAGFNREDTEIERFQRENKSSLRKGLRASRLEARFKWASEVAIAVATAAVVGVAARRVVTGVLSPGDVLVFISYLRVFYRPLRKVSQTTERMARATASGERVLDMLAIEPVVKDSPNAVPVESVVGAVLYDHVNFAYSKGTPVLFDINVEIRPRERVAIVGATGSGKSSFVSLLPRFYDPVGGKVCLDGRNIREFTLSSLRRSISLVFQEPFLFATTIAENIGYGKSDATPEEIREAAENAGIHPIIEALPESYETLLGERGSTLSGGQRQCVAIARAMIKNAPIVILDEPTTGLDVRSAELVMSALERLMKDKTVIVVTHQLENIRNMDRVIVLREGRIIQDSPPSEIVLQDIYQDPQRWKPEDVLS